MKDGAGPEPIVHMGLALLRVSEPAVFDEIRALVPLDDYALGMLSGTEMLVDPRRLLELQQLLDAKGLRPLVTRG